MMKFLSTTIGLLMVAVGFLYYLVQNVNFLPIDVSGNYIGINIAVLFLFLFIALVCMNILLVLGIRLIFVKHMDSHGNIVSSVRFGLLLSIGILIVYLLHFFHILNFVWGSAILIVVILSLFVI